MSDPQKLLDSSDSELVLRLLRSGTVERPAARSLERTMLTLGRQESAVRTGSRSAKLRRGSVVTRGSVIALLAFLSFAVSGLVSYLW